MMDRMSPYDYIRAVHDIRVEEDGNAKRYPDKADEIEARKRRRIADLRRQFRRGPWLVQHPWIAWALTIVVIGVTAAGLTSLRLSGWLLWTLPFVVLAVAVDFNVSGTHPHAKRAVAFSLCTMGIAGVLYVHQSHVATCRREYASYITLNPPGWITGADGRQTYFSPMAGPQWAAGQGIGCEDVYP
jgi:hypothetical protein